jgi:tetratricopeptide (TPR) repeat protein
MTSRKTTTTAARRPNPRRAPAQGAAANVPASAGKAAPQNNADSAIARAQQGKVNVTPETAVEMAAKLYGATKYEQAVKVCRQLLASRPGNADAYNILGVSLHALGRGDEAVEALKRATELAPEAPSIKSNLGEILRQQGRIEEAAAVLEESVKLDPENAQALNNLGITYFERRQPVVAIDYYKRAIAARPDMAEAHNNLGNALRLVKDIDGAIEAYQEALTYRERYPEAYNNLGTLLQQQGKLDEAEHALRKAVGQNPGYIEAYDNLASVHIAKKNDIEALRVLGDALKIVPTHVETLVMTARTQLRRGAVQLAEQAARLALKQDPDNPEALLVLGQVLHEVDKYEEALESLERAVEANPNSPEALNFYGVALKSVGRLDEARECMLKALRGNRRIFAAYANLNDLLDFSEGEGATLFEEMDRIFKAAKDPNSDPFLPLHFAYAKALDDRGEHEQALSHYITGGKLKRAQLHYDESETHGFFDRIRAAFTKDIFENRPFAGNPDERPVFIVGMPRSGSTLVEQIISSHPDIYGAGEVKYLSVALSRLRDRFPSLPRFPDMMEKVSPAQLGIVADHYLKLLTANSGNSKRVTDKLLTNYFFAGLIHLLFPNAKIINTQRDPVDTCLSGFTKLFKDDMPHSYDLGELGRYYGKYRELMEHWHEVLPKGVLKTVQYEDVVADTEKEAKALIAFLGLKWDPKCVDFHKSDRPVKTASVAQVRKPIYKTAVKRWKKYGDGLQPLVDAIAGKPAPKRKAKATENA